LGSRMRIWLPLVARIIMKRESEIMEFDTILRDEQIVSMLAIKPNTLDSQGDIWGEEAIVWAKENFNKHFKHWGVLHRDKEGRYYNLKYSDEERTWADSWDDEIELINSYILSNNAVINGNSLPRGSWVIDAHIKDNELWERIKNKELNGASVGGMAIRLPVNSHKEIIDSLITEISFVDKPANRMPWLITKNLEEYLAPFPNFHSCSVKNKGSFQPESFRTIESKTGKTNLIIGRLKGETTTTIQAIRYPISKYSESVARQNCQKHKGSFEPAKEQ